MARAPNIKVNEAYELYKKGYKLIDISKELEVPDGTVRRWKKTYGWDNERSQNKNERSEKKIVEKNNKKEPIADEVKEVLENSELTDKQKLFCILYIKCFNATKAYKKAYGCSYETALTNGPGLLRNTRVKKEIEKIKKNKLSRAMLNEDDIFQKYIDIAFSDITDYLTFGQEEVPVMGAFGPLIDKETKEPITKIINVVKFKESTEIDGTLISEVKQGKDGASIKLQDKMKALQWLSDRLDLIPKLSREKLELEKRKIEQVQEKLDYEKNKNNQSDEPIEIIIKRKGED